MTDDSNNPPVGWKKVYKDEQYIIEQHEFTLAYRHRMTDPTISGSERFTGLPENYFVSHRNGEIKKKPETVAEAAVPFIDSNPKTAFGAVKPGTFQTPVMPFYEYSLAHYQGALKYGHMNWREDPVSISTYINAARRHIDLYIEGQTYSSDTGDTPEGIRGIHNLAHAMTCLSIVMDAEFFGTLIDDRSEFRAAEKLEQYFEETKKLQQHLMKTWTGHAQQLKATLNETKSAG